MLFTEKDIRAVARERHTAKSRLEVKSMASFAGLIAGVGLVEMLSPFVGVPVVVGAGIYLLVMAIRFQKGLKKASDDLVSEWKLENLDPEAGEQIGPVDKDSSPHSRV